MVDENVILTSRARDVFNDAMQELTQGLAELIPTRSVVGVRVTEQFGLTLGVVPGASLSLMTACGLVVVDVEPRREDEALRRALKDALAEIDEHNHEYKYKTPKAKLDHWRRLVSGAAVAEAEARLDATGGDDGGSAHRSCIGSAGCKTQTPQSIDDPSSGSPAK